MNVTVTLKPNDSFLEEQPSHRAAEGIPSTDGETHQIPNAVNIEQQRHEERNDGEGYVDGTSWEYPSICVTDTDGVEHSFDSAVVNLDETEPDVDIWMVHDETPSNELAKVTYYTGYGIQSRTFTDSLGTEHVSHSVYIQTLEGEDVVFTPHNYRGFVVSYPDGSRETVGEIDRHSATAKRQNKHNPPQSHPIATETGHMTVTADKETYTDVVNVSAAQQASKYMLHTRSGNSLTVSEITDVEGALYTVSATHESVFEHGHTTTSVQRAVGAYVESSSDERTANSPILKVVGHPKSASVYKTPVTHKVAALEDIDTGFVKTPSGDVYEAFEILPQFPSD